MQPEIISETKQYFDGKHFHQGTNKYFYKTLGKSDKKIHEKSRESLHRYVWKFFNRAIPKGYVIHHKDENKSNNSIENLELMEKQEHTIMHIKEFHRENPNHSRECIERNQDKCREWHKSKQGNEWHKQHFENVKHLMFKQIKAICTVCNKEYETIESTTKGNLYCSNKCCSKARRDSGIDDIDRECEICKKTFRVNRYAKKRFCSSSCRCKASRNL